MRSVLLSLVAASCLFALPPGETPRLEPVAEVPAATGFTEGPAVDAEGNVYFSDLTSQRIFKLSAAGVLSTFRENSNRTNGLVFDSRWRLVACETGGKENPPRITRTDMTTGRVEVLAERFEGKPLNGPNDVTFDGRGRLYFTDPAGRTGIPAVYRIDTDGSLHRILAGPDIQKPNGVIISPDDRTLYLVESNQAEGGARMIRAYDLQPDGSVKNMRVHYNFYPGRSADGMAIDAQGNIWAAAGLHRTRGTSETLDTKPGIHVISPQGKLLQYIPTPQDTVTNCAFGGPRMDLLYVTAGKTLYRIRTSAQGTRR